MRRLGTFLLVAACSSRSAPPPAIGSGSDQTSLAAPVAPDAAVTASSSSDSIVGLWTPDDGPHLELTADGHWALTGDDPSQALRGTYRRVDAGTIELTYDTTSIPPGLVGVSLVGGKLAITDPAGSERPPELYTRIK